MASQGASRGKEQINLSVDSATARALRLIAVRDGKSVPDLLRPGIERLVRHRLKHDADLAESARALESSVAAEQSRRRRGVAPVTDLKRRDPPPPEKRPLRQPSAGQHGP
jgi:hypothetical protein